MPGIALAGRPQDVEFAALAQRITQVVITSAIRASVVSAGGSATLPQDDQALEHTFWRVFSNGGATSLILRSTIANKTALTGIHFGDHRSVAALVIDGKLLKNVSIALPAAIRPKSGGTGAKPDTLADYIAHLSKKLPGAPSGSPPAATREGKELLLKIDRVHCVERVGLEPTDWDGKDQILCGGLGFDSTLSSPPAPGSASTEHFRKVPQFTVGTFGADGNTKNWNPDKTFCKWQLNTPGVWPRAFFGIISMAERDSGDEFPDLLKSIWEIVSPQVIQGITALAAAGVGLAAGAIIGSDVPVLGTIVGAIVGGIVGFIVGLVIDSLRDDLLETSDTPVVFILPSLTAEMPSSGRTPKYTAEYARSGGNSGLYQVRYYWEVAY